MSDMTIEKAHLELNLHRSDGPDCGCLNCAFAWGFLEGAASRDPEVAELQAELDMHKTAKYAAREASRKLVEAAQVALDRAYLYKYLTTDEITALAKAIQTATPGHSPEGKTL